MRLPVLMLALSVFALAGCEEKGPAERLGENIDDGVEAARESVEDAADAVNDRIDGLRDGN